MLDLFLTLVDRLLDLAKTREKGRDKWVALITSLHKELITIHSDYLAFFERAKADLSAGTPVREVLNRLIERRLPNEAARRTLRATFYELQSAHFEQENQFMNYVSTVHEYMSLAGTGATCSSAATSIIDEVERRLEWGDSEADVSATFSELLTETLRGLRGRFDDVTKEYGKVQAESV